MMLSAAADDCRDQDCRPPHRTSAGVRAVVGRDRLWAAVRITASLGKRLPETTAASYQSSGAISFSSRMTIGVIEFGQ
jgi:hypothetical protein